MKVFVYSKGIVDGPYTIEQIKKKVAEKQIDSNDLAYIEDKFKYIPIHELLKTNEAQSLTNSN